MSEFERWTWNSPPEPGTRNSRIAELERRIAAYEAFVEADDAYHDQHDKVLDDTGNEAEWDELDRYWRRRGEARAALDEL